MAELLLAIGLLQQSEEAQILEQIMPSKLLLGEQVKSTLVKAK